MSTGRVTLLKDAIVRLRAADGTSHSRGLAFAVSLVLVQGLVVVVGFAVATGSAGFRQLLLDTIQASAPGPTSDLLTNAVEQATRVGREHRFLPLTIGLIGTLLHGDGHDGSARARDEPDLRHREGPAVRGEVHARVRTRDQRRRHGCSVVHASSHSAAVSSRTEALREVWLVLRWPLGIALAAVGLAALFRWSPKRRQPGWAWLAFGAESAWPAGRSPPGALALFFNFSKTFGDTYGSSQGSLPSSSGPSSRRSQSSTASPWPRSSKRCGREAGGAGSREGRGVLPRARLRLTRLPSDGPTRLEVSARRAGESVRTHVSRRSGCQPGCSY